MERSRSGEPAPSSQTFEVSPSRHSIKLLARVNALRAERRLCDVILRVGTTDIPSHRAVLAASSPYFFAMFTSDMAEAGQSIVTMRDMDPTILERLIDFVYTGRLDVSVDNVQDLLAAAALLQLEAVQTLCSDFLKDQLDPSNCLGIRNFAEATGCASLADAVDEFARNRFSDVAKSDEFLAHSCDRVAEMLSSDDLNVRGEEEIYEAVVRWIAHDKAERAPLLPTLLRHVRLPLLDADYLVRNVDSNELVRSNMECRDLLDEAKRYHLVESYRRSTDLPKSAQLRKSCVGVLYAVGGKESSDTISRGVECYRLRSNEWNRETEMIVRRQQLGVGFLTKRIYAVGGSDGTTRLSSVEAFDPVTSNWAFVAPMNTCRSGVGVGILGGNAMYAAGGYDGRNCLNTMERYDLDLNMWSYVAPMTTRRSFPGVTVLDDKLYVVGGNDGSAFLSVAECYHPHLDRWASMPALNKSRAGIGITLLGGRLFVGGGNDGTTRLESVECYDPRVGQWELVASMKSPRDGVCMAQLGQSIIALGGINGPSYLNSAEMYDPRMNRWEMIAPMESCRAAAGAAVIPSSY